MPGVAAVVFDLDGTLVDSRADIAAAANHVLELSGRPRISEAEIARHVGDGARLLVARVLGLGPMHPETSRLLEAFVEYYSAHAVEHTTLMSGAAQALDELADLPLAICTNKPRRTTEAVLAGLGIAARFRALSAGGDLAEQKPDPAPLLQIASRLGLAAHELVMVGDGPQDVECGRRAGARTVGVLGGIAPKDTLLASRPDAVIESLADLATHVRAWRA